MPADAKAIFLAAADRSAAERAAYLRDACGDDSNLRRRVDALLRAHDEPAESLANLAATPTIAYGRFVPPSPTELARHFPQLEIVELIGAGGMGAVYKARQPHLDRFVALKILPRDVGDDAGFAERFTREARTLAKLSHPGIVPVHDFGSTDGLFWFVMEYVNGANLREAQRTRRLTPGEAINLVGQVCDALQSAHDDGVAHRDIKPENVLLDRRGRVKVADFGLAKILGRNPEQTHLTGTHQIMGTPHYMAPEQWERPLDVDHRADIYALGVVLYELLTGELPLGRFAVPSAKAAVGANVDAVVLRMLEKDPEQRFQKAADVKADLERPSPATSVTTEYIEPAPTDRPRPTFYGHVIVPTAILAILMAVVGMLLGHLGGMIGVIAGLTLVTTFVVAWLAKRKRKATIPTLYARASRAARHVGDWSVVGRLRNEPFVGYAGLAALVAALFAHLIPWSHLPVPGARFAEAYQIGIMIQDYGMPSAIALALAFVFAEIATVAQLLPSQNLVLRVLVCAGGLVALYCQVSFAWRPTSFWGVHIAIAATILAVVFSVLRLLDRRSAA